MSPPGAGTPQPGSDEQGQEPDAVNELLLVANQKASAEFRYLEAFAAAGTYYLGLTLLLMLGQSWVERRIKRRGRKAEEVSLLDRLTATANAGQVR